MTPRSALLQLVILALMAALAVGLVMLGISDGGPTRD